MKRALAAPDMRQKGPGEVLGDVSEFMEENFVFLNIGQTVEFFGNYFNDIGRIGSKGHLPDSIEAPDSGVSPGVGLNRAEAVNFRGFDPLNFAGFKKRNNSLFDIGGKLPLDFLIRLCKLPHLL